MSNLSLHSKDYKGSYWMETKGFWAMGTYFDKDMKEQSAVVFVLAPGELPPIDYLHQESKATIHSKNHEGVGDAT